MNCVFTVEQQRLLFGKVYLDLKKDTPFDFKSYSKDFFDLVANKTGDKVLAANYVALLPLNIRAVMGVNKAIFRKLAGIAGQISDMEAQFEDFSKVEDFVNNFVTSATDILNLEKTIQEDSLTKAPEQEEVETTKEIAPIESLALSDVPFDNDRNNFLKPEMKIYADAKTQLINNVKPDGSSVINNNPVRLAVVSTSKFNVSDFYPDTQRALVNGDAAALKGAKEGVVLAITDLKGAPVYFNEALEKVDRENGKVIYYTLRKPVEGAPFNQADMDLVKRIQKEQNLSKEEAEAAVNKKLNLIRKVRNYISDNIQSHVNVNLTGGIVNYTTKIARNKVTVSKLNMVGGTFAPYKGIESRGQKPNVYYFDYPASNITMPINGPSIPQDLVDKLTQLLTEDINIRQGSKSFKYSNVEKLKIFNQFIYTEKDVFDLSVDPQGNFVVKKLGVTTTYPTKQDFANDIQDLLTRKVLVKKISAEEAAGKVKVRDLKFAMYNQIYEQVMPGNNVNYYSVGQVQLKINDTAFKNNLYNDFNLVPDNEGFSINVETKPYYPFVANNFLIGYDIDDAGNLQTAGSILNFEIAPEDLIKMVKMNQPAAEEIVVPATTIADVPVENKLSAKEKLLRLRDENPDKFNKLIGQKGLEATLDQIDAAEKWYNNHPMSTYFPFETLFDVLNQEDSNSIATWTTSGVTLFKGADYSDLYHEAWHGFTQGFLNKDEKVNLYNEVRKKAGSFIDYNGKKVNFKDATELQAEEFLAEDFREYMLSDGKSVVGGPIRNGIFRRIWNFLKQLFGGSSVIQNVTDEQVTKNITELYEKLRVGDISAYTFAAENRNFDTLNKALTAIKEEKEPSLSFENSNLIFSTINSLFSEGIDILNQANIDDINERRSLQVKKNLTSDEQKRLDKLNAQNTSSYTTLMLSTTKGITSLYDYAKSGMEERLNEFKIQNQKTPSTELQKKIELLRYAIDNFGDIKNLNNNVRDEGVIGYHLFKSDLIEDDVFEELQAQEELVDRELEGKNYFDRGGNESSIFDLASREIRNLISSLNKTDLTGTVMNNQLGFPELVSFKESFAYIARLVQNSKDLPTMYERLENESAAYPPIKQLLNKLGPLYYEGQTDREVDLWSKFFQALNKYRVPLVQTTVNEQEVFDEYGGKTKSIFDVRIGNALADYKRIDQDWRANFAKANNNPFIKNDTKGNYLDVAAVMQKYPTIESVNADPIHFLNDIGILMKEITVIKTELEKAINSGNIRLNGIYKNLNALDEKGIVVRGLGIFLQNNKQLNVIGQTGPNSNYGKLLGIQSKYSGDYSDFMVQNAAGDPQSEFTQNSSLTQLVKQINAVGSYNELVANAATAQYNNSKNTPGRPFNPFINSSIWMNSLFNMGASEGPRYDNELVIENLSGINSSMNDGVFQEGVALAQADEVGKLLNDFHVQLMKFTPELTRHAGKKTSLAVSLRNYKTGSKNARLYVDTEDFISAPDEFNQGFDNFQKIITKYIGAELDRINYAKYLLSPEAGVQEFDFAYLNRGTKFVAFAGVLSEETKNMLYAVPGNLSDFLNSPEGLELNNRIYDETFSYFNGLVDGVEKKLNEYNFVSPTLIDKVRTDAKKLGKDEVADDQIRRALTSSFVANNWIHHFEEMIVLYGDIALYKDFFKRNASLNSTGDIIRNDEFFINYANNVLGKPFAKQLNVSQPYNGILKTAVVSDVLVKSVYLDEYKKAVDSPVIDAKYGKDGINEADAQGLISMDTYRIIMKGLSKWTPAMEEIFQDILAGKPVDQIKSKNFFPTLKMGYYGPVQSEYLPLTGLHKFALFPLIPGAIPQNLQALHEKMMKEGIDYLTFESGSKVGTVSKKSGLQPLYSNINKRELNTELFVQNKIFAEYLKYQVEASPKYKNKITLMTQLRKLALLGLEDKGVPVDYKGTPQQWDSLNETQKKLESKNYTLRQNYINSLKRLVDIQKKKILSEIGWKRDKNGNLTGDMSSLLELISDELKRADVGEHEWAYIQTIKGKEIKNSLDISQSADMIEKVMTSLANKRMINIKVRGEQLVMVSTTGFEDLAFAYNEERNFEKPTDEDLLKYGTNDLPTYHIRNGKIAAAKVKIAMQGDFKKLLNHKDVKAKANQLGVTNFEALNLLLKDDVWVSEADHRELISMVGARIPTQGPNSADFVEVYEFLPEIAGNIIIAPSEVTSKGGSDFDYDKLPLMMPNIKESNGEVKLATSVNEEEARKMYDKLKASILKDDAATTLLQDIFGQDLGEMSDDEQEQLLKDSGKVTFEEFFDNLNGTKVAENDIMKSLRAILEQPSNFADLIRPNETDLVKPYADTLRGDISKDKQGTRMYEPLHNIQVQQSNAVGKDTLGIGAISNSFNAVFNSVGLSLNPVYGNKNNPRRANILLPHNSKNEGISLSNRFDALNENNIADVISQLINGWVDVEKDDWISNIQGNKEIAPTLLFMVQAGVPIKQAVYFVSQPLIVKYAEEQRLLKSSFADVLGKKGKNMPKSTARKNIIEDPNNGFVLMDSTAKTLYAAALDATADIKEFDFEKMQLAINSAKHDSKYKIDDFDRAVFLHFIEIENMAREVEKVSRAFNVDTTTLQSMTEFYGKVQEINGLAANTLIPQEYIKKIKDNSPIGPFYIQEFALDLFSRVLPLRNSKELNSFLNSLKNKDVKEIYDLNDPDTRVKFYQTFKNDLISYVFQNELRGFKPGETYSNNKVSYNVANVEGFKFGAFVKDDTLYVDENQLKEDYDYGNFSDDGYGNKLLAPTDINAFVNLDEYKHFVYERETLRNNQPFSKVNARIDFSEYMNENYRQLPRKEDETEENYINRMEKLSYEQWLRDKALMNIFNPYQLFKSKIGVAGTYGFIVNKYPALKQSFSVLNNIKISSKDGFINLMPSTLKFNKDEIDTFNENFKNLANSNELLKIDGIDQRDADFISNFFKNLPIYLYFQSGPNTRSAFSFARITPNNKILRILEKPIDKLTKNINDEYLNNFLTQFIIANANTSTRNRYKEFLKSDQPFRFKAADKPTLDTGDDGGKIVEKETYESSRKLITDEEVNEAINKCKI